MGGTADRTHAGLTLRRDRAPDIPRRSGAAWLWRRLQDEPVRRGRVAFDELRRQGARRTADLHHMTARLGAQKAWASQVRCVPLQQRPDLNGWKELMRRVGRSTGRRAPEFLAEARRPILPWQSAVPV